MSPARFSQSPVVLRKVRLDNIMLMPASALPFKAQYQELANRLPQGGVLIISSKSKHQQKRVALSTAELWRRKGTTVQLLTLGL